MRKVLLVGILVRMDRFCLKRNLGSFGKAE